MTKFRVPSLSVDLIYHLGVILRTFAKIEVIETECWTFEFNGVSAPYKGRTPVTYYGKGHLTAKIPEQCQKKGQAVDRIQVRAMCDLFPHGDYDQWLIYYWVKYPTGVICSSSAQKRPGGRLDHGWARTDDQPRFRTLSATPPREISFK